MKRYSFVTHNGVASMAALLIRELIREQVVPAWVSHLAVNADGQVWGFEEEPWFCAYTPTGTDTAYFSSPRGAWLSAAEDLRAHAFVNRYRFDECPFAEYAMARFEEVRS